MFSFSSFKLVYINCPNFHGHFRYQWVKIRKYTKFLIDQRYRAWKFILKLIKINYIIYRVEKSLNKVQVDCLEYENIPHHRKKEGCICNDKFARVTNHTYTYV